jgi:excisionase family DNA binding protein
MSTDIFDLQTASAYLGISPRSLRARCKKRQVAHARDGRAFRFTRAQLDKYLEKKTVQPKGVYA